MVPSFLTTLSSDVLLLPAAVYVGSTSIGVTRGGLKWDPGWTIENVDFDGKQAPIYLLDRKFYGPSIISGKLIELGDATTGAQIAKIEAGMSTASAGTPNVTTITPLAGNALLASGSYQSNLRMYFDRGVGSGTKRYLEILFAKALCTKYSLGGPGTGEAEIDFEFQARKDMSSGTVADAPYVIQYREALA